MPTYVQADRPLSVSTPLGADKLIAVGFSGREGLSQLFHFRIDAKAELKTAIDFDKLLGQPVSVKLLLPQAKERFFHGICSRVSQGESDNVFTDYRLEVVPQFWLLTKRAGSRIFQQKSVPDILKEVLAGLNVIFQIQGTFAPRDFCVQYRETDFNFACRLMEEEGIFYFFKHTAGGHQMVVANTPGSHPDLPTASTITYKNLTQAPAQDEEVIYDLGKTQEVTSGKFTLWDHSFELPHKHLEAEKPITDTVQAGQVTHKLKVGDNGKLEVYDWPGEYAQRFDGVAPGGGDRAGDLQKIFTDNKRTVEIRMQEEATGAVVLQGSSNCRQMVSGHKFTLKAIDEGSKSLKADGSYVLTAVSHTARLDADYRTGDGTGFNYSNSFTCIPAAVTFRPPRVTPKPIVPGTQTAVVVGPKGEEIFTDKYGRVKVQFHWDRQGKNDADSSCWVRVTQPWAGKRWGGFFIPRIGQEVIVDFQEGDPDQPIIVGAVYNADQMHPYLGQGPDAKHKQDPKLSGFKTNTTPGGVGFNELRFDDTKGQEQVFVHAERNMDERVKNDRMERVIHDRHLIVGADKDGQKAGDQREKVYQDKHLHVLRHQVEQVEGNVKYTVGKGQADDGGNVDILIEKDKKELIEKDSHLHVKGDRKTKFDKSHSLAVGGDQKVKIGGADHLEVTKDQNIKLGGGHSLQVGQDQNVKVGMNCALESGMTVHIKAGMTLVLEAGAQLSLKVGGNFIDISPAGVSIQGTMVLINSGGAAGSGPGASPQAPQAPDAPTDAAKAEPTDPTQADDAVTGHKSCP
jgi:type VI secretion system secreted protein VgrG